jgi:hypothetical protein
LDYFIIKVIYINTLIYKIIRINIIVNISIIRVYRSFLIYGITRIGIIRDYIRVY